MRPICWLHLSDIHMRLSDAWSQDGVLKAMCNDMARQRGWSFPRFSDTSSGMIIGGYRWCPKIARKPKPPRS